MPDGTNTPASLPTFSPSLSVRPTAGVLMQEPFCDDTGESTCAQRAGKTAAIRAARFDGLGFCVGWRIFLKKLTTAIFFRRRPYISRHDPRLEMKSSWTRQPRRTDNANRKRRPGWRAQPTTLWDGPTDDVRLLCMSNVSTTSRFQNRRQSAHTRSPSPCNYVNCTPRLARVTHAVLQAQRALREILLFHPSPPREPTHDRPAFFKPYSLYCVSTI